MAVCCFAIFASGVVMTAFVSSPQKYSIDSARWKFASEESARFIEEQMPSIQQFPDRFVLLTYALSDMALQNGLTCEFGVFRGESLNYIASVLARRTIHGFDSFQGNPEDSKDFLGWKKGLFDLGGKLPKVRGNVILHKGWFDQSVPEFARQSPRPMAFMHMEADPYSSTRTVFDTLADSIVPETGNRPRRVLQLSWPEAWREQGICRDGSGARSEVRISGICRSAGCCKDPVSQHFAGASAQCDS